MITVGGKMIIVLQGKKDGQIIIEKEYDYTGGPLRGRLGSPSELVQEFQKEHPDLEWSYEVKK